MKQAIEKSIYYSGVIPAHYNPIVYEYTDLESFSTIIESLKNEIDVISIFAPKEHVCYNIFNQLPYYYHELMLDKVAAIFLVNRQDCVIKLSRTEDVGRVAILKIDSVLSEIPKKTSYFSYPLLLGFGIIGGIVGTQFLKE